MSARLTVLSDWKEDNQQPSKDMRVPYAYVALCGTQVMSYLQVKFLS